jgi:hypothetical protein
MLISPANAAVVPRDLLRLSTRAKAAAIRHALVTYQAGLAPGTR